jgi:hypothetical protein
VGPAEKLGSGKQKLQVGKVLVAYRQTGNLLLIEHGGNVGAFRLQLRLRIRVDFNSL